MEMVSFAEVIMNPVAQAKFIHTVSAGYTTACMFVLGISSWYMLKGRDMAFAKRSFAVAIGFGLASVLCVMVLGDESGYTVGKAQQTKLAVIEAEYHTAEAPAPFTVFGLPNDETMEVEHAVKIPWLMGLIATRSTDQQVMGIRDIIVDNEARIRNGMVAYSYLEKLRAGEKTPENIAAFEAVKDDLGYGLLLKRYVENPADATDSQIKEAARNAIPAVAPMFWSFRLMVGMGVYMFILMALGFWYNAKRVIEKKRWLLKAFVISIPVPWIAAELGWFVAEFGRQPWSINDVLPTFLSVSDLTRADLIFSMSFFALLYTVFLIAEMYLMMKYARLGPSSLHTGRYHFEKDNKCNGCGNCICEEKTI
jgi:cytochrome bd ubiquinol oxidase subunit I